MKSNYENTFLRMGWWNKSGNSNQSQQSFSGGNWTVFRHIGASISDWKPWRTAWLLPVWNPQSLTQNQIYTPIKGFWLSFASLSWPPLLMGGGKVCFKYLTKRNSNAHVSTAIMCSAFDLCVCVCVCAPQEKNRYCSKKWHMPTCETSEERSGLHGVNT